MGLSKLLYYKATKKMLQLKARPVKMRTELSPIDLFIYRTF